MGWWRTDDGEAVVGDGPVDLVIEAWHDIGTARAERKADPLEPAVLHDRSALDAEDRARLDEALDAVAVEYRDSELDRDPTPREIVETIDFAVGELEAAEANEANLPPELASGPRFRGQVRLARAVILPAIPFSLIHAAAEAAGLRGGPTTVLPPLLPGEPELAEWAKEDVLVSYTFDPAVVLRVLSSPVAPDHVLWQRLTAQLPTADEQVVRSWLHSDLDGPADPAEGLIRGIRAVEALGLAELLPLVVRLQEHPRQVVAEAARRVAGVAPA